MSDHASPAKERRKADLRYAAVTVAAVGSFATMAIWMQGLSSDLRVSNEARDALARQVQSLGHKPVAGPPGSRGEAGQSVVGRRGPQGVAGSPGPTGSPGSTGKTGAAGASGVPGVAGSPGDTGASGAVGSPGPAGVQGEAGPAGPVGPQGDRGEKGDTGDTGATGPAPSGWTFTDNTGVTQECAPDSEGSTHYTCQPVSPADPTPTPSNPESAVLVLSAALVRRRIDAPSSTRGRHRAVRRRGGAHR